MRVITNVDVRSLPWPRTGYTQRVYAKHWLARWLGQRCNGADSLTLEFSQADLTILGRELQPSDLSFQHVPPFIRVQAFEEMSLAHLCVQFLWEAILESRPQLAGLLQEGKASFPQWFVPDGEEEPTCTLLIALPVEGSVASAPIDQRPVMRSW